jgi:hypothetical protein
MDSCVPRQCSNKVVTGGAESQMSGRRSGVKQGDTTEERNNKVGCVTTQMVLAVETVAERHTFIRVQVLREHSMH